MLNRILLTSITAFFLLTSLAGAQEVRLVTKSFKVMEGRILELTDDYVKIETEDGIFRIRLSQLDDPTYDMLYELPKDVKAQLKPEPPEQKPEDINFAEINWSDWDASTKEYLAQYSKVLDSQGRMLANSVFSSVAKRRKRVWGKMDASLENKLLDLRAQAEVDVKNFEEETAPPRLEKFHQMLRENYKLAVDLYSFALEDKYDKMDQTGYQIMENARVAYEELLNAYQAVYAPSKYPNRVSTRLRVQDELLDKYRDKAK